MGQAQIKLLLIVSYYEAGNFAIFKLFCNEPLQPLLVFVQMICNRAATNNSMNCECLFSLPVYLTSKVELRFIRFVGESAALILCSTPTKVSTFFGRPIMGENKGILRNSGRCRIRS
jgi:hypothetical protein